MLLLLLIPIQLFAASNKKAVDVNRWNHLKSVEYSNSITNEDLELYVPTDDLTKLASSNVTKKEIDYDPELESDRNDKVGKKIMDHTFKNFAKGKLTPNVSFFKTVQNIEDSMKYDITIPKESEDDIEHKFNVQYQPFQNMAKIKYRGFLQANLEYFFSDAKIECSIEKELSDIMQLALTHGNDSISPSSADSISMFMLRWVWQ